jgi:hypothetical protein
MRATERFRSGLHIDTGALPKSAPIPERRHPHHHLKRFAKFRASGFSRNAFVYP